jgi:hypothetical protein
MYNTKKPMDMKKLILPLMIGLFMPLLYSCGSARLGGYSLNERDAAAAIRQLLEIGTRDGVRGAFTKENIMTAIFPESLRKTLNTLNQLGLTEEINRFTTTLSTAAEETATASIPIFVSGITTMKFNDATRIIKSGGTSATEYLRTSVGDSLRRAITPIMKSTLDQYKLNEQWEGIVRPVKIGGTKLNLDLPTIMAGVVSEAMFQKIEEKERQIRTEAAARTTPLLQKVFSRNWN